MRQYIPRTPFKGEEGALLKVAIKFLLLKHGHDLSQMSMVLLLGLTKHQDVIVYNHKLAKEGLKNLIHWSHKCTRGIREPKWHHQPLIKFQLGFKSSLPLILFTDLDLVIPTSQINLKDVLGPMELIKHVFQPWDWVSIFDSDLVDGPTIHTHHHKSLFLWHKKSRNRTWAQTLIDQALRNELFHLSLNLQGVFGVHSISGLVG